ncbi:MAG: hypothetical protein HYT63_02270 [Candidatus Yanofskybacteria bacterium]|nr:hypothetical protein [Candidatus Yanofskybacteria bacterium]
MKNKTIYTLSVIAIVAGVSLMLMSRQELSDVESVNIPGPSETVSLSPTPEPTRTSSTRGPQQTGSVGVGAVPLPTGDSKTAFVDEPVPWNLLLGQVSCQLQGEVKFLNRNTYDNQDAKLIYSGVDHPARNISWTVTPQDDISVGPNIFSKLKLPNGESLLGIALPENPKYKKYELTVKIQYGRLVDAKGNFVAVGGDVKVFEKQCSGKTTIVLP